MIGMLGILFILPNIIWKSICQGKSAHELINFANTACQANPITEKELEENLSEICDKFEMKNIVHKEIRSGYATMFRRFLSKYFSIFSFNKTHGTWLISWYILMKILYIVNCFGQLTAFRKTFTYTENSWSSFPKLLIDILLNGKTWEETRMFPKHTLCLNDEKENFGGTLTKVYNCVVPANVLNEKLIPIIWFYIGFVTIFNILSLVQWTCFIMIGRIRRKFLANMIKEHVGEFDEFKMDRFANEYLKCDGVFLVKMINSNCCRSFSVNLVNRLYLGFLDQEMKRDI